MSDYKLTVYADPTGPVGHFSVGITGPGINMPISGKYMRDANTKTTIKSPFGVSGKIGDDSGRMDNDEVVKREFPLTRNQAEKAASFLKKARENPGEYELFGKNCVDLVQETMNAAGVETTVDQAFSNKELDRMGEDSFYGAGDEAQRRGLIIELEKDHEADPNDETRGVGPHADKGEEPKVQSNEVSEAPVGVGLGAEAARNAAEDAETNASQSAAGDATADAMPVSARAKAMAIVASGKNGHGTDQGGAGSDLEDLMLKPVDDLTEDEAKALGQWSWKLPSNDPKRLEVEERRRDFYVRNYGDKPSKLDETGRMAEPEPVRDVPQKPKGLATPNGELVSDALKRFAGNLARPVADDGETTVVKALQSGLSMLGDVLKVDGVAGPKTKAALKRTVARHGAGKAEEAFGIGRFRNFAETERNTGGSASGLKQTVEKEVQPLFGAGRPKVAAETLQESLNDLGAKAARERNKPAPEPLKVDGDIGPKTTDAFRSALAENGPEKLTKSYTSMLGFSD